MDFFVDDRHVSPFFPYFSFLSMIFQLLSGKKLHEKKHGFSRAKNFMCILEVILFFLHSFFACPFYQNYFSFTFPKTWIYKKQAEYSACH